MWSPLIPTFFPDLAREAREARPRAHQQRRVPHRSRREDQHLAFDFGGASGGLARRVGTFVVEFPGGDDVAVGPRLALNDQLGLGVRANLDAHFLGRRQVVGDDRVLGPVDAAGVTPLRLDAATEIDRQRHAVARVAGAIECRRPQSARLRDLLPAGALHAKRPLRAGVEGVERRAADLRGPHAPVGTVVGPVVTALEGLARRAQRRGEVEVGATSDAVADDDLRALPLDQPVDPRQVLDVHRLAEVRVLMARTVVEHDDAGGLAGRAVELGQAEGGDRAAEARAHDADVETFGHRA